MSSQVVSFLLKQGGTALWNYIKQGQFGKAKDQLGDIRKAQEDLLRDMTAMHFEQLIWNSIQKIRYWTTELEGALEEEKKAREKNPGAPLLPYLSSDMTDLLAAIKSMGDGVGFHIANIISGVTGKGAVVGKDGLIGAWNKKAHDKLANLDKLDYTIKDYLFEVEANLTIVAGILKDANELRSLIASDDEKRQHWSKECADAVTSMQDQAWKNFPIALQKLKPSYKAQFISEQHWWRFEYKDNGGWLGGPSVRFLAVQPSTPWKGYPVSEWNLKPCPPSEWRFASVFAELSSDGVVVQTDKDKSRLINIKSRIGDCRLGDKSRVGLTVEREGAGDFTGLVFKVVPLLDTTEPEVRFALKRETTAGMKRENGSGSYFGRLMDDVFILRDEGVGQFEYLAPADEPSRCIIM